MRTFQLSVLLLFLFNFTQAQSSLNCTNWLATPSQPSLVTIGDLDITGNQVTVEATFNRTSFFSNGVSTEGDIVSKHTDPSNANYLLRPTRALITTTNGFFATPDVCPVQLNKTYHVAMVYNGISLKFYRNGFLMSQVAASGNMIQNDFQTAIGMLSAQSLDENLVGYINEVRIWNIARTQNEIRTYMGSSLPTPTLQPGLLAYYTFDNLQNKQGNSAWNGTSVGSASINVTNPNCTFIPDSCAISIPAVCNTFLATPSNGSYASIGDLDISGTNITVEATINRTTPYLPGTGDGNDGDIVSKHLGPPNTNYLLRPNHAYITTSNGFFATPDVCEIELNKTYHLAMVYDGSTLKFYRNGFLMSQVPATGTLFQNDYPTRIGMYTGVTSETFIGYINNVRIWNTARTQAEIRAFMSIPLPTPTTQPGLQAYYVFDDATNKQGNPTWNASISGSAALNQINPKCPFLIDSCSIPLVTYTTKIINDYTPVVSIDQCKNILNVADASNYNQGDTVMIIQMKGASIDTTNTGSFGTVLNYNNAGNYEFNTIKTKVGNALELAKSILRSYDFPDGKVQLIRVPYYISPRFTEVLTCLPWDGNKGGVLVYNARDTIKLGADINVNGKGFRGGKGINRQNSDPLNGCGTSSYFSLSAFSGAQEKGEGISDLPMSQSSGRGPLANGGGGANASKSGGGGGSNGTPGGHGGDQYELCTVTPNNNGGLPGKPIIYSSSTNRIFLGGGGGAGDANGNFPQTFNPNGGNGGGIVMIISPFIDAGNFSIYANGDSGKICLACQEGMGGGGAGGTILLNNNIFTAPVIRVQAKGGKGADNVAQNGLSRMGPGGGGSGGVTIFKNATLPASIVADLSGGANGISAIPSSASWGATPGSGGISIFNIILPISSITFKPNIDSVRLQAAQTNCRAFNFNGLGYTNTTPVASWKWSFGDGGTASTQNTSHNYNQTGTFQVKLIVTDINGCKDSIVRSITTTVVAADAGLDTAVCSNNAISRNLHASGIGAYSWSPSVYLDNPTSQNPVATISNTTKFYLTVTGVNGCKGVDSVLISVNSNPFVKSIPDSSICKGSYTTLATTGASSYTWSPAAYVSNASIGNPLFISAISETVYVTGTNSDGCFGKDTINIIVKPLPTVRTIIDPLICNTQSVTLNTTGATTYTWSPAGGLSSPIIGNPVFSGAPGAYTYVVTGMAANNCLAKDTVNVTVRARNTITSPKAVEDLCQFKTIKLDGNNGDDVLYSWTPVSTLSNALIKDPIANPVSTTNYTLVITDTVCLSDTSFFVTVRVNPLPNVNASKSNDISCAVRSAKLFATGAATYSWAPASTLSNPLISNPVSKPSVTTLYTVTGVDSRGCENADTVRVYIKSELGGYNMPNTFTPNGDRINECFGVTKWGDIQKIEFIIYNRWGTKVFESNTPNKCWNGTYKGVDAEEGNYVYYIKAVIACGEIVRKGNVLLIR